MAYRCSDGMCGADDCETCGHPEMEEEEQDFEEQEPETDTFIEKCGVQI